MGASRSRTRLLKKRKTTRKVALLAEKRLQAAAGTPTKTPAKPKTLASTAKPAAAKEPAAAKAKPAAKK